MEELAARPVDPLVGVCAEVVALRLDQVGGQALGAVAVVERERARVGRHGDAAADGGRDGAAPAGLGRVQLGAEVRVDAAYRVTRDLSLRFGFEFIHFGKGIGRGIDTNYTSQDVVMYGAGLGIAYNR